MSNQTMLDALQAAMLAIVEGGQQSYSVSLPGGGSREYTALDIDKLQKAIDHYSALVNRSSRRMFAGLSFREAS